MKFYHITSENNAKKIMENGFQFHNSDEMAMGYGIYFASEKPTKNTKSWTKWISKKYPNEHLAMIEVDFPSDTKLCAKKRSDYDLGTFYETKFFWILNHPTDFDHFLDHPSPEIENELRKTYHQKAHNQQKQFLMEKCDIVTFTGRVNKIFSESDENENENEVPLDEPTESVLYNEDILKKSKIQILGMGE